MASEAHIQAISRFIVGYGTEMDNHWRDYNLDLAGKPITYGDDGTPIDIEPAGNSGYSLGSLQWDFGQGTELAGPMIDAFAAWIPQHPNATPLKSSVAFAKKALALDGDALSANPSQGLNRQDVDALSAFVRSDVGSDWVNTNVDNNLIGSDAQKKIKWKDEEFTQVAIARQVEATVAFQKADEQDDSATTDLIYALGMKTYNQSPNKAYKKMLLPFLAAQRSYNEVASWYTTLSGNARSGAQNATELSIFWSDWRSHNAGSSLGAQMVAEMDSQCLANPVTTSRTRATFVLAKQIFENPDRFAKFATAFKTRADYISSNLFDLTTGAIKTDSKSRRRIGGVLLKKKIAYVWNAAGDAYKADVDTWEPFPIAKINAKTL